MKLWVLSAAIAGLLVSCGPSPQEVERTRVEGVIEAAKLEVAAGMLDPTSILYRKIGVAKVGDADVVCGEYNAKNTFGAYTGFSSFSSTRSAAGVLETKASTDHLTLEDGIMCYAEIQKWMAAYTKDKDSPEAFNLQAMRCSTLMKDRVFWSNAVKVCPATKPLPSQAPA